MAATTAVEALARYPQYSAQAGGANECGCGASVSAWRTGWRCHGECGEKSSPAIGGAQTSDQTTRGLEFSASRRETIYQSLSKTQKNNAAPIGFRPAVGSVVPKRIDLAPLPDTLGEMIPEARGYEVAMVEKQILLVDPRSKVVIALMTGE